MMRHLTAEDIIHHIENKYDKSSSVSRHVQECERCQEKTGDFRKLLDFLNHDTVNDPPADVLARAFALFQPQFRPGAPGMAEKVRRVAKLIFDSLGQPLPAGVRYSGTIPRQLLFRVAGVDIDVRIDTHEGRVSLTGQALPESGPFLADLPVRLECQSGARFETRTNPVGEFWFDTVPEDTYHLEVHLPDKQMAVLLVPGNEPILT